MTIAGIDPGQKGGIGIIGPHETFAYQMPIIDDMPDIDGILHVLKLHSVDRVYIEEPCGIPGQSSVATFTAARAFGRIEGGLYASCISVALVRPARWKDTLGLTIKTPKGQPKPSKADLKAKSIALCCQLFPGIDLIPEGHRVRHDGMAEALLIARYGRLKEVKNGI